MAENNQQYKWRQRKKRNMRITVWILLVILASAGGTFLYEGLRDSDPQTVAENYIKESAGVQEYAMDAGERSLNKENQFVQDYTFTYTADGKETAQKVSLVQQSEKKYGLFEQWQIQQAGADAEDMELIVPAGVQVLINRTAPDASSIKEDDTLSPGAVCYQLKGVSPTSLLEVNGLPFEAYSGTLESSGSVLDVRGFLNISDNAKTQMQELGKSMIRELYTAVVQGKEAADLGEDFAQVPTKENLFRAVSGNLMQDGEPKVQSLSCSDFKAEFGEVYYPGRDEESFIGVEMKLTYTCEYEQPDADDTDEDEAETEGEPESSTENETGSAQKEATFYFRYQNGNCVVTSAEVPGVI